MKEFDLEKIKKDLSLYEPWDKYYEYRYQEYKILFFLIDKYFNKNNIEMLSNSILEIGTGIGFTSVLLSQRFNFVDTVDLLEESGESHSLGEKKIKDFLSYFDNKHINFQAGDARNLYLYKDKQFNCVYSSQVLEHIPVEDRHLSLKEMARVLQDDGYCIITVPSFMERVYYVFWYYGVYSFQLVYKKFLVKKKKSFKKYNSKAKNVDKKPRKKKRFFIPKPHGEYKSSVQEFYYHLPFMWKKEIQKYFVIKHICCHKLSVPLSTPFFLPIYNKLSFIDKYFGDKFPFKYFGRTIVFICKKI